MTSFDEYDNEENPLSLNITLIIEIIDTLLSGLIITANEHIDYYWSEWNVMSHYYRDNSVFTRIGPSIRCANNEDKQTFCICWNHYSVPLNGKRAYPTYIKKGNKQKYKRKSVTKHAQDWEMPLFDKYEDIFYEIRHSIALLNKVQKQSKDIHDSINRIT